MLLNVMQRFSLNTRDPQLSRCCPGEQCTTAVHLTRTRGSRAWPLHKLPGCFKQRGSQEPSRASTEGPGLAEGIPHGPDKAATPWPARSWKAPLLGLAAGAAFEVSSDG